MLFFPVDLVREKSDLIKRTSKVVLIMIELFSSETIVINNWLGWCSLPLVGEAPLTKLHHLPEGSVMQCI